jgi:hypothetical protein
MTAKQPYVRPEIDMVGSLRSLTLATNRGVHCDKLSCSLGEHQTLAGTNQAS